MAFALAALLLLGLPAVAAVCSVGATTYSLHPTFGLILREESEDSPLEEGQYHGELLPGVRPVARFALEPPVASILQLEVETDRPIYVSLVDSHGHERSYVEVTDSTSLRAVGAPGGRWTLEVSLAASNQPPTEYSFALAYERHTHGIAVDLGEGEGLALAAKLASGGFNRLEIRATSIHPRDYGRGDGKILAAALEGETDCLSWTDDLSESSPVAVSATALALGAGAVAGPVNSRLGFPFVVNLVEERTGPFNLSVALASTLGVRLRAYAVWDGPNASEVTLIQGTEARFLRLSDMNASGGVHVGAGGYVYAENLRAMDTLPGGPHNTSIFFLSATSSEGSLQAPSVHLEGPDGNSTRVDGNAAWAGYFDTASAKRATPGAWRLFFDHYDGLYSDRVVYKRLTAPFENPCT
ncbi:MAG TPA: hypothetical protein VNZ52_04640 [Candidatus Thermoplasmatota archaeon]|nr:hypothetical protein [Candidatus Thermoplasmatota archaeon]